MFYVFSVRMLGIKDVERISLNLLYQERILSKKIKTDSYYMREIYTFDSVITL